MGRFTQKETGLSPFATNFQGLLAVSLREGIRFGNFIFFATIGNFSPSGAAGAVGDLSLETAAVPGGVVLVLG